MHKIKLLSTTLLHTLLGHVLFFSVTTKHCFCYPVIRRQTVYTSIPDFYLITFSLRSSLVCWTNWHWNWNEEMATGKKLDSVKTQRLTLSSPFLSISLQTLSLLLSQRRRRTTSAPILRSLVCGCVCGYVCGWVCWYVSVIKRKLLIAKTWNSAQ